jgi:hypothetical protein
MAITIDGADNKLEIGANATGPSSLRLYEDTDNGTNYVSIIAPSAVTSNRTITLPDATGTLVTNSGSEAGAFSTLTVNSNNISAENSLGFRNRIINGDMRIDQRNAGASLSPTSAAYGYAVDRFPAYNSTAGSKFSIQRSTDAPTGFSNSVVVTSSSAYSVAAGDQFYFCQFIEGFNSADFAFGTASAKTVTLSFWVKSSLTGTFGGSLMNSAYNRSYPFSYTISSANTWEQKSVTIAGDTTGTWIGSTNGLGIRVHFGLGIGSTYSGTAGAWAAAERYAPTGAVSVVGTNGATFYITGVQLEVGSVATPFERRDYGRELAMCQRYFVKETGYNTKIASRYGSNLVYLSYTTPVEMRTTPTVANSATNWQVLNTTASENSTTSTVNTVLGYVGGNVDVVLNTSFNPAAYIYIATSSGNANSLTFSSEL